MISRTQYYRQKTSLSIEILRLTSEMSRLVYPFEADKWNELNVQLQDAEQRAEWLELERERTGFAVL